MKNYCSSIESSTDASTNKKAHEGTTTSPPTPDVGTHCTTPVGFRQLSGRNLGYYSNSYQKDTDVIMTLAGLLKGIKNGRWREEIVNLRQILQTQGKGAYDREKVRLPAVTVSGVISGIRKDAHSQSRVTHSGLLQIDIDQKDNLMLSVQQIRDRCMGSPHVIAVWDSPSGTGIKAIVPIRASLRFHHASFVAAESHFQSLGLKIDPATKDSTRLMFVSYDPGTWTNPVDVSEIQPDLNSDNPRDESEEGSQEQNPNLSVTGDEVRSMLSVIPPRPDYQDWTKISWAVFSCLPPETALQLLKEWSPEESPGEYLELSRQRTEGPKVGFSTLLRYAEKHGYIRDSIIPEDVLPLPAGGVGYRVSGTVIFKHLATTGKLFIRGGSVWEILESAQRSPVIQQVSPERFMELVETVGKRVAERQRVPASDSDAQASKRTVWRKKTMPHSAAKVLLESEAAREYLPPLRQIANSPIIIGGTESACQVIAKGYHPFSGGTYVLSDLRLDEVPGNLPSAVAILKQLVGDFDFASPADFSRAIASFLSPALKMGGLIEEDFPLDVAEADQSQSGKTYRQKMVAALYGENPTVITGRRGGVGGLDESVANALLAGKPFIAIDNLRGSIDSPLLETALRGHGFANCRGFRASANIDVSPFIFQLSTNGAEFTRDLANRSVITRIRKRPNGYSFRAYPEGDILKHLKKRRGLYLNAVFIVIREWVARGKPRTDESRHDFREWVASLDWIVRNFFRLAPLMDGHRQEQERTSNPNTQWLRDILLAADSRHFDRPLTTSEIVGLSEEAGLDLPGSTTNRESSPARAGKILGRLFTRAESDELHIEEFVIKRTRLPTDGPDGSRTQAFYVFNRIGDCG